MNSPQENEHRRFRGYKVDRELQGVKDASLGYTMEQIRAHCQRVTVQTPDQEGNCINMNCAAQKYYIDCFEVLRDRKECIRNLRFEVEQNGQYRLSHLKTD